MLLSLQGTVPQRGVHVHRKLESVDYLKERGREGEGKRNRHKVGGGVKMWEELGEESGLI